jgi:hypothetical protein
MPGGYVVRDANGQALTYLYSRDNPTEALQAKTPMKDEARRIAIKHRAAAGAAWEGRAGLRRSAPTSIGENAIDSELQSTLYALLNLA